MLLHVLTQPYLTVRQMDVLTTLQHFDYEVWSEELGG